MHSILGACALVFSLASLSSAAHAMPRCERELARAISPSDALDTRDADAVAVASTELHLRLHEARLEHDARPPAAMNDNAHPDDVSAVLIETERSVRDLGLGVVRLDALPLDAPAGRGLRRALRRLRGALIGRPRAVISPANTDASWSAELAPLPPAIGVPLAAGQLGAVGVAAAFRRTTARVLKRSRGAMLNTLFVLDLHLSARRPGLPPGWREFIAAQGMVVAVPTIFFYLAFRHGAYRWEAMVAEDPARANQARRTTTALTPLVFALSGPVLAWASAPARVLAHLGPLAMHPGQLALTSLAVGAGLIAARPRVFDHAVPLVERLVYQPLGRARDAWVDFASQFKTAPLARAAAVDK